MSSRADGFLRRMCSLAAKLSRICVTLTPLLELFEMIVKVKELAREGSVDWQLPPA